MHEFVGLCRTDRILKGGWDYGALNGNTHTVLDIDVTRHNVSPIFSDR
jgi:hypothetical protein